MTRTKTGGWRMMGGLGVCVAAMAGLAVAGEFELKLTVQEPAGVARKASPVCGGVPLPWGRFPKNQAFSVHAGAGSTGLTAGQEIPAQVLPLVVDEKDFLRWILVDIQTDLATNETRTFTLKAVPPKAKPVSPVKLAVSDKEATVDTGRIKFAISKEKPFSLFSAVEANGKPVTAGGEASYTDFTVPSAEKKRYVADKPERIEVQYDGPLRVTLKVTGRFVGDDDSKLRYIAWITAWAGRSDVLVKYALANSNPDQYVYRRISDSTVALKLVDAVKGTVLGAASPLEAGPECWMKQGLLTHWDYYGQHLATNAAIAGSGDQTLWGSAASKKPADWAQGWIAARAADRAVWACDRFFFENPPRELAVEKGMLALRGVIERFEGPMVTGKDGKPVQLHALDPFKSKARWLLDCNHISSEYVLDFAPPAEPEALSAAAKAARQRTHLLAPAEWYSDTECFEIGKFCSEQEELKCYDLWGWKYDPKKIPQGPTPWDFPGPHLRGVRGTDHHYDTEHDILESLVLLYVRSGKRPHFEHATGWANFGMDTEYFRTDDWRWKDGGIWWTKGGPAGGNRPQRPGDPVTGLRESLPPQWSKGWKHKDAQWGAEDGQQVGCQADSRTCHCHTYGAGMAAWFCITGDPDARDAVLDQVEQNHDFYARCRNLTPGQANEFSRDFTRAVRVANAARLIAPADAFVIAASDLLAQTYLKRPRPEPRGFVNPAQDLALLPKAADPNAILKEYHKHVGDAGIEEMKKQGIEIDPETGALYNPKKWNKWHPVVAPQSFMLPMLYIGMDSYHRITGNEDARDWLIALGEAFAKIAYQRHGNFVNYSTLLVDFPVRGVSKDLYSWNLSETNKYAEGVVMGGYTAKHWPDVCARAYALCGEPLLKQRAYDYWFAGSHRAYNSKAMHALGGVGTWLSYGGANEDNLVFTARTFYEHARPRADEKPPEAVTDLAVTRDGTNAVITFTAPADEGGGKIRLYQVKCSDRAIVDYDKYLELFNDYKEQGYAARMLAINPTAQIKKGLKGWKAKGGYCNWWMAANLQGEPAPHAAGARETFTVTGVPEDARFFAVRSYDDSNNLGGLSNVFDTDEGKP